MVDAILGGMMITFVVGIYCIGGFSAYIAGKHSSKSESSTKSNKRWSPCNTCGWSADCNGVAMASGKCVGNMYTCPSCKTTYPKNAWEMSWDHGGPRCPKCGHGSMDVLSDFVGPIESGRN